MAPSTGAKKSANAGSAIASAMTRNASTLTTLPSQIALRSHGVRTSPSSTRCSRSATNARVSASSAVKSTAIQSRPSAARSDESAGSAKRKTTRVETTNRSIAGTVSRERSSSSRFVRASAATSAK